MKGWKAAMGAAAALAAADCGIAAYFFKRTMLRQNASTERTMKMSGTDWESHFPVIQQRKEQMSEYPMEDIYIKSRDGLKLHATYIPGKGTEKMIICFHGYTGKGMTDFVGLSGYYLPQGYRMLLVDQRAHGESEGDYVGFGCLDRMDVLSWIAYVQDQFPEVSKIWLHGISMGGSTVLMSSSLRLPDVVKGIISDCAFTSAWDVFSHVLKEQYHLPPAPILAVSDQMVKKKAGYSLNDCNAVLEVKKAKVPILFIHGDADTFVPSRMVRELYDNCASPKELLIVQGAGHAEAYYKDSSLYEEKLTSFLNKGGE